MMKETVPFLFSASEPTDRRHVQLEGLRSLKVSGSFVGVASVFAVQVPFYDITSLGAPGTIRTHVIPVVS